jgi:hypothetical protein
MSIRRESDRIEGMVSSGSDAAPSANSLDKVLSQGSSAAEDDKKAARREGRRRTVRDRLQEQIDQAEEAARKEQFRKRMELARAGVRFFVMRRYAEAVKAFHSYLAVLEDHKQVPEGGLSPQHFDLKEDLPELLIISGVYWDLLKLYDRTESAEKYQEFLGYVEKYVQFVVGMPYQPLAAETVRKYLVTRKAVHVKDFKALYQRIAVSRCFIAGSLIDLQQPETTPLLRRFREQVLRPSRGGRVFIAAYEAFSPVLVPWLDRLPDPIRRGLSRGLDRLAVALARCFRLGT